MGLLVGTTVKTKGGRAKIKREIDRGKQGTVYEVEYGGEPMALKWYHNDYIKSLERFGEFYANIENNIREGSPSDMFLWPVDISEMFDGSFGYIMRLVPAEYKPLSRFLLNEHFESFGARIDAMANFVNGFRILHKKGYRHHDLNDGNFFIDRISGRVLACDNDNVAREGHDSGIVGKMRYMAPEVVVGDKLPDTFTDRYSLSVILFFLAFKTHPLEGQGATPPCLTPAAQRQIYGTAPVFVFDPADASNRPIKGVHDSAIEMWSIWPEHIRQMFVRSFSKDSMRYNKLTDEYAAARPDEDEWLTALVHARGSLVTCPHCGSEEFAGIDADAMCTACHRPLGITAAIRLGEYCLPAAPGVRLYRIQLESCDDDTALMPVAEVIASPADPTSFGIRNLSQKSWRCITSQGVERELPHGAIMPVKAGIRVITEKGFEIVKIGEMIYG